MIPPLIGLVGRSGAGKDEIGRHLVDTHGFQRIAFADPLKEAAAALFGLSREQLWGALRNDPDPRWHKTPRELYQRLGDAVRTVHPHALLVLWATRVEHAVEVGRRVVVTDVRLPAEAEAVRTDGGVLWRVTRPGRAVAFAGEGHATETAGDEIQMDATIENTSHLRALWLAVDLMLRR